MRRPTQRVMKNCAMRRRYGGDATANQRAQGISSSPGAVVAADRSSVLLHFVEEHRGGLTAVGIFGGFSGLLANATINQYVVAAFGFLLLLFLYELQRDAPNGDADTVWMFRTALGFATLVLFLGWSVAVSSMRPSIALLPPLLACAWLTEWTASRPWPPLLRRLAGTTAFVLVAVALVMYLSACVLDLLRLLRLA